MSSIMTCTSHTARWMVDAGYPWLPQLTTDFTASVAALPIAYNADAYAQFVFKFGAFTAEGLLRTTHCGRDLLSSQAACVMLSHCLPPPSNCYACPRRRHCNQRHVRRVRCCALFLLLRPGGAVHSHQSLRELAVEAGRQRGCAHPAGWKFNRGLRVVPLHVLRQLQHIA